MSSAYATTALAIVLFAHDGGAERAAAACTREAMSRCSEPLRVLTDNRDLGFAATERELSRLCPTLMEGIDCMENFAVDCLKPHHRSYFNTLYAGTQRLISGLCSPGDYQTEYLLHAPCMRTVQRGYEVCADEYHSQMDLITIDSPAADAGDSSVQIQMLCCSFKSYLHCSQQAVMHRCGIGTANFTKNFLERLAGPLVQTHCAGFTHGSDACLSGVGGRRPALLPGVAALLALWLTSRLM
ncbi:uncharacterized protein LOC119112644 [Pollicipes pollicipes]|uniref:uncharacterized protein LOC119112644 n=1 Tax=Pollicipes pollicipes TaxID=41117 RepID=UPI0018855318|nr:uncharacterized protein LOC119112644 [Pollicipes pollicipes]